MKPNDERYWTKEAILQRLLAPRPTPKPKPAVQKAEKRWSGGKPVVAVLQDAQRADAAATERLRKEREEQLAERRREQSERIAHEHRLACYQAAIDAAWQASRDYQEELARWGSGTCHRGPGDPDWQWLGGL